jgi:hypothetical protein
LTAATDIGPGPGLDKLDHRLGPTSGVGSTAETTGAGLDKLDNR